MADIWSRLSDGESNFVERKQSAASTDEIRRTIVAFANSVPVGDEAVLFIGVKDDGTIVRKNYPPALHCKQKQGSAPVHQALAATKNRAISALAV